MPSRWLFPGILFAFTPFHHCARRRGNGGGMAARGSHFSSQPLFGIVHAGGGGLPVMLPGNLPFIIDIILFLVKKGVARTSSPGMRALCARATISGNASALCATTFLFLPGVA